MVKGPLSAGQNAADFRYCHPVALSLGLGHGGVDQSVAADDGLVVGNGACIALRQAESEALVYVSNGVLQVGGKIYQSGQPLQFGVTAGDACHRAAVEFGVQVKVCNVQHGWVSCVKFLGFEAAGPSPAASAGESG